MVSKPTYRRMSARVQPVYTFSEHTSRGPFARGTACLYFSEPTSRTVGHGCSLFIRFRSLPPGDCGPGVKSVLWYLNLLLGDCLPGLQPVFTVSEPLSRVLLVRGAAYLYDFRTYLPEMLPVLRFQIYLQGSVGQGCSLFIQFQNLPLGACRPRLQGNGFQTYLKGTVGQECSN